MLLQFVRTGISSGLKLDLVINNYFLVIMEKISHCFIWDNIDCLDLGHPIFNFLAGNHNTLEHFAIQFTIVYFI